LSNITENSGNVKTEETNLLFSADGNMHLTFLYEANSK